MSKQSDMPSWWRCDTHGPGTRTAWGCPECVLELRTSLATATRECDEARARVSDLVENGERLKAVADSVVRDAADIAEAKCALLRDRIEHQVAQAQNERDEARAEVAEIEGALRASGALNQTLLDEVDRLRKANEELYHGTMRQAIRLAATKAKP